MLKPENKVLQNERYVIESDTTRDMKPKQLMAETCLKPYILEHKQRMIQILCFNYSPPMNWAK